MSSCIAAGWPTFPTLASRSARGTSSTTSWSRRARSAGRHDGVARTGGSVCVDYVQVARIRRGKHVSVSLMFDRLLMLEQLGLV